MQTLILYHFFFLKVNTLHIFTVFHPCFWRKHLAQWVFKSWETAMISLSESLYGAVCEGIQILNAHHTPPHSKIIDAPLLMGLYGFFSLSLVTVGLYSAL